MVSIRQEKSTNQPTTNQPIIRPTKQTQVKTLHSLVLSSRITYNLNVVHRFLIVAKFQRV